MTEKQVPSLWHNQAFVLYFLTLLASGLSVAFFLFAVNWYVVDSLELEAMLGIVFFATSVPRLVFMLLGGVIADRVNRAVIMLISDFTKAVLLIALVVLLVFQLVNIWVLVILALFFGLLDAFFWPASQTVLPGIVSKKQLTRANSVAQLTMNATLIAGPMFAGFLIGFGSYELMFLLVSVMLFAASVIDWMLKKRLPAIKPAEAGDSIWKSIKSGFLYVKNSPFLTTLMLTSVFLNLLLVGPLVMGLPIYANLVLGGDELTYSYLNATSGAGMLAGALLVGVLNIQRKRGLVSVTGILLLALAFLGFGLIPDMLWSLVFIALIGVLLSIIDIPLISAIQANTEEGYIGRVMSMLSFAALGLVPVSYLLTSLLLAAGLTIDTIMIGGGVLMSLQALVVVGFARSIREVD
ncbi:MFS transporter [Alkalicoccus halolimnae]|uniref:MFS transporter n=1 Tax=Alkalicoccus halolimnae TaxID=1667239 RepID=A0A5C7FKF2_9BACI|nr:MFS transporter [Alkalicoccus halolimnae]TXF85285.1 MFS transporter [Alkalicoccus halolimnae]